MKAVLVAMVTFFVELSDFLTKNFPESIQVKHLTGIVTCRGKDKEKYIVCQNGRSKSSLICQNPV